MARTNSPCLSLEASGTIGSQITFCQHNTYTSIRSKSFKLRTGEPLVKYWRYQFAWAGKMIKAWPEAFPGIWAAEADLLGLSPQQVYTAHFMREAALSRYLHPVTGIPLTRLVTNSVLASGVRSGRFLTLFGASTIATQEAFRIWMKMPGSQPIFNHNYIRGVSGPKQNYQIKNASETSANFWSLWVVDKRGILYTSGRCAIL